MNNIYLDEIHIRDPYILVDNGKYYMYGTRGHECAGLCTGIDVYVSKDLKTWTEAHEVFAKPEDFWADRDFWAPEVHKYMGKYYMFVSFKSESRCRGTQILASDSPLGPFEIHSEGPVTPSEWECLDGTLYIDKNSVPYMVFCHEWVQVGDGQICAVRLSEDLKTAVETPKVLFKASDVSYITSWDNKDSFVTDGPFFYRLETGRLIMIWSSFSGGKYCEVISYSDNGDIDGNWMHCEEPLFSEDGGHGMIFKTKENNLCFVMHYPNITPYERAKIIDIIEEKDKIAIKLKDTFQERTLS